MGELAIAGLLLLTPSAQSPAADMGQQAPATIFAEGAKALAEGQLPEAEHCFRRVSELDPTSSSALVNLGVTQMRERRWPAALDSLDRAKQLAKANPATPVSLLSGIELNIGLAHYRAGSYAEAAASFRNVLALAPSSVQASYLLGISCFLSDDYAGSVAALEPLWPAQSGNLNYLYVLAGAAGKLHRTPLEERALLQMQTVGAGSAALHLYTGKAMLAKGEYAGAVSELQQAIALTPSLPMAHFFLAEALHAEHHDREAAQALEAEIALEPDVPYSYDELGEIETDLGRQAEAQHAYEAAIAHDATLASAYVGLARIYRTQHREKEALAMLDHAEQLRPASGSIHYLRAQVLKAMHEDRQAAAEFSQAATLLQQVHEDLQHGADAALEADADQMESAAQL